MTPGGAAISTMKIIYTIGIIFIGISLKRSIPIELAIKTVKNVDKKNFKYCNIL